MTWGGGGHKRDSDQTQLKFKIVESVTKLIRCSSGKHRCDFSNFDLLRGNLRAQVFQRTPLPATPPQITKASTGPTARPVIATLARCCDGRLGLVVPRPRHKGK